MRKALLLASLAALGALSFGCAITDYGTSGGFFPPVDHLNKSQGVIDCHSDDRVANTQQTAEVQIGNLLYTSSFGSCPAINSLPNVTVNTVSQQDARDWQRFDAMYSFNLELGLINSADPNDPYSGEWILSTVKDIPLVVPAGAPGGFPASVRIDTYYAPILPGPSFQPFSCVGSRVDGRYGGPEGTIMADALPGGRISGLGVETVAIDSNNNTDFCSNIAAVSALRATNPLSTYTAVLGRTAEGRLEFTPITRHAGEGMASLLDGGVHSVTFDGVTATGRGTLEDDGSITLTLLSLSGNGATYQAETPVTINANPENRFRTMHITVNTAEEVKLAQFGLAGGFADAPINLQGQTVPEFGVKLPAVAFQLNKDAMQAFINAHTPGNGDGNPGFGG